MYGIAWRKNLVRGISRMVVLVQRHWVKSSVNLQSKPRRAYFNALVRDTQFTKSFSKPIEFLETETIALNPPSQVQQSVSPHLNHSYLLHPSPRIINHSSHLSNPFHPIHPSSQYERPLTSQYKESEGSSTRTHHTQCTSSSPPRHPRL